MSISVICSECETRLSVQDDLLGRQMRCPICREVFTVKLAEPAAKPIPSDPPPPVEKPAVPRTDEPIPTYRTGTVADFLPILPTEAEPPREIVWSEQTDAGSAEPPSEVIWSETSAEPKAPEPAAEPKEIVWTDDHAQAVEPSAPKPAERFPARRKRSRLVLLVALTALLIGGVGAGAVLLKQYIDAEPDRLFAKAREEYAKRNYDPARKLYTEFAEKNPDDPRAAEARYFTELCGLRLAVYSVSVRTDPTAAVQQFDRFLAFSETPTYQPFVEEGKYKVDVWECAVKLTEEVVGRGNDRFSRDEPGNADPWIAEADRLAKVIDRFRPKDLPPGNIVTQIDSLRKRVGDAKERLEYLADVRDKLSRADDAGLLSIRSEIEARGYGGDAQFQQALTEADRRMAEQVSYKRLPEPTAPGHRKTMASTSLLFAPRLDRASQRPGASDPGTIFFALARGILYALDESDGHVLWAARTGVDADTLPLHIPATDLHPELAIVVSQEGDRASLTACLARTGETFWHQQLPAPAVGRPLQVGQRLYVSLHDEPVVQKVGNFNLVNEKPEPPKEKGVVLEFDLTSGSQMGRIVLGRPHGGPAVRRPGTGQIFFPAEARAIYVFDMERHGPDGNREDPVYLGMLATGHPAGALRGAPVLTAADGDFAGYLILPLADSLESATLRAYLLPPADQKPALPAEPPATVAIRGWPTFTPYCDSEKLALVTDRGEFDLFGIRQAGNVDRALFAYQATPPAGTENGVGRGQVLYAGEESIWFVAGGRLHHLRTGFDFKHGQRIVPHGKPMPLGEPLHDSQVNSRKSTAMVVAQSAAGACRATAIDLLTGAVRWQRQLGMVLADNPARIGDGVVFIDHGGGIYRIDAASLQNVNGAEWLIDDRWLVATPLRDAIGQTYLVTGTDEQTVLGVATVETEKGNRIIVRQVGPDAPVRDLSAALPAAIAGHPVRTGRSVILPLANGLLYRMSLDQPGPLEAGPTWRAERLNESAQCRTASLGDDFVVGDGAKSISRWHWPTGDEGFRRVGSITLSDKLAGLRKAEGDDQIYVADVLGNVTLWDAGRFGPTVSPLRSWRAGEANPLVANAKGAEAELAITPTITLVPQPDGTILLRTGDDAQAGPNAVMRALPPLGWLFPATPR